MVLLIFSAGQLGSVFPSAASFAVLQGQCSGCSELDPADVPFTHNGDLEWDYVDGFSVGNGECEQATPCDANPCSSAGSVKVKNVSGSPIWIRVENIAGGTWSYETPTEIQNGDWSGGYSWSEITCGELHKVAVYDGDPRVGGATLLSSVQVGCSSCQ
jgi:hypothetical protein